MSDYPRTAGPLFAVLRLLSRTCVFECEPLLSREAVRQLPIDGPVDIHINAKLAPGESIADLGGLRIAYFAFKAGHSPVSASGVQQMDCRRDTMVDLAAATTTAFRRFREDSRNHDRGGTQMSLKILI